MAKGADESLVKRLRELRAARGGGGMPGGSGKASRARHDERDPGGVSASEPTTDLAGRMAALGVERARQDRVRPTRDLSLADEIDTQARLIRSVQKGISKAAIAWDQVLAGSGLPDELLARVMVKSYRRGVLTIRVRDSGTQYLLARFLRAGGEAKLARLAPVVVNKVKLVM